MFGSRLAAKHVCFAVLVGEPGSSNANSFKTAPSQQSTLSTVVEGDRENKKPKNSGAKKPGGKKAVAPAQAVGLLAPLEAVLVAEGCLKDGDRLEPLSSAFPTRLTADFVFPTVDPEVCGRAASVHPA